MMQKSVCFSAKKVVSYKQTMDLHDMAHHMAEHNTAFSEGLIVGVLTDFVKCVREMVLNGNTVKVGNLAIFKATVESNGLEVLYDAQSDKVASATMGTLKGDWQCWSSFCYRQIDIKIRHFVGLAHFGTQFVRLSAETN